MTLTNIPPLFEFLIFNSLLYADLKKKDLPNLYFPFFEFSIFPHRNYELNFENDLNCVNDRVFEL